MDRGIKMLYGGLCHALEMLGKYTCDLEIDVHLNSTLAKGERSRGCAWIWVQLNAIGFKLI